MAKIPCDSRPNRGLRNDRRRKTRALRQSYLPLRRDPGSSGSEMIEPFATGMVRGFLHRPEQPSGDAIVLTHGAGSNCQAPLLVRLSGEFATAGLLVLRCDLPFR